MANETEESAEEGKREKRKAKGYQRIKRSPGFFSSPAVHRVHGDNFCFVLPSWQKKTKGMLLLATMRYPIIIFLFLFIFANTISASEGDELPEFQSCVNKCILKEANNCSLPLYLKLTFWTCSDDCQYNCMQNVTSSRPPPMLQFYGKWPFYRLGGIQEPASVLFSLGNLFVHYYYWRVLRRELPKTYFMRPFALGYAVVNMNTWVWSSVFHTRDTPLTEKLDYFCAASTLLFTLFFTLLRVFCIRKQSQQRTIASGLFGLFLVHVAYMSFVSFDYLYNMIACGVVAVIQGTLWVGWYLVITGWCSGSSSSSASYAYLILLSTLGNALAVSLEVFDFPPVARVFDAHSLWHLATIAVAPLWYHFILRDGFHLHWSALPQQEQP